MLDRIWHWWRRRRRFELYQDAFSLDVATKERSLLSAARHCLARDEAVLLIAHFPATFWRIQDLLHEQAIPYEIAGSKVTPEHLLDHHELRRKSVLMVLAEAIERVDDRKLILPPRPIEINALVAERYPLPVRDDSLGDFFRQLPFSVRMGYFLSLQDPCLRLAVNDTLIQLMRQMGLKPGEMISSHLVSRRLSQWQRKLAARSIPDLPAESPDEWLAINLKLNAPKDADDEDRIP